MLEKLNRKWTLFNLACGKVNPTGFSEGQYGIRYGQPERYSFTQPTQLLINLPKKIIRQENRDVCIQMFVILKTGNSQPSQK